MKEKLFIAAILLLCLVPSVGMLLPQTAETGGNEVLAPPPGLRDANGTLNTGFLPQLNSYVEDHYFLRQQLVSAWSALNRHVLHTSVAADVVLGRDGWLYFGDTLNDYTGAEVMTDRDIFCAARNLALMDTYCQQQGARFLFTIAPNKNSLYPEHMPDLTIFPHIHDARRLLTELDTQRVPYIDLFSLFGEQDETLYFTQDSHWNSKGAALAADAVNGGASHYFDGDFVPRAVHQSDLYAMLYPTGRWLETDQTYGGELSFEYETPFRSANDMTIATTGGKAEQSLVLYRDSFGILLYPYLADSYQRALFSRGVPYRMDLAVQREADLVVVELVERNLDRLIREAPVMPAPECAAPEADAAGQTAVPLEAEPAQALPGHVLVKGTLPEEPDARSPVSLCAGDVCREAFLLEDGGFALYLPESAWSGKNLSVVYTAAGRGVVSAPAHVSNQGG